jgi:hypothetical protein
MLTASRNAIVIPGICPCDVVGMDQIGRRCQAHKTWRIRWAERKTWDRTVVEQDSGMKLSRDWLFAASLID